VHHVHVFKAKSIYKMDTYTGKPFILFCFLYSIRSSSAPALIGLQDYSNLFFFLKRPNTQRR
jgi:hypothetical protein